MHFFQLQVRIQNPVHIIIYIITERTGKRQKKYGKQPMTERQNHPEVMRKRKKRSFQGSQKPEQEKNIRNFKSFQPKIKAKNPAI